MRPQKLFIFVVIIVCILSVGLTSAQDDPVILTQVDMVSTTDSPLDAVALSPDGVFIATGGRDNVIRVWEIMDDSQTLILELNGHTDRIVDLAFSPDGHLLASASADTNVHVWDVFALITEGITNTDTALSTIEHHSDIVTGVAFSPDGTFLASSSWDATVWIGLPESGLEALVLDHFGIPVWELAFAPTADSLTLTTAGEDGMIWLWGLDENASLTNLSAHDGAVMHIAFNADGTALTSGGMDGRVNVWDLTVAEPQARELGTHLAPVTGVAFAPESEVLMSTSLDGTVRVWDTMLDTEIDRVREEGLPLTALAGVDSRYVSARTDGAFGVWTVDEALAIAQRPAEQPVTVVSAPVVEPQEVVVASNDSPRVETVAQPAEEPRVESPPVEVAVETDNTTDNNDPPPPEPVAENPPPAPQIPAEGTWISVPLANIASPITQFPLDGVSWAIDPWERNVGYLQGTAWFNQNGNTVLGGHSEYPDGQAGVFYALYNVSVGDVIIVTDNGAEFQYRVVEIRTVNYTDLSVVYPTDFSRLTLITCDVPSFSAIDNVYYDRLVVIADLIG